ncbi:MAG: biotin transporter BioY [Saccharofermentans sp.]|nr:biotin transporter BioY [Saccharofermentans sp.]
MSKDKRVFTTKDIVLIPMFTALIAVGAFIKIPLPTCPLTLQWFFVMCAGILLGSKKGAISTLLYVLLGLIGLPIFTGGGGFWYVFQPTFGYFIGFIVCSFLIGIMAEKKMNLYAVCLIATVLLYIIGSAYAYVILNFYQDGEGMPIGKLLFSFMVLPLPGDIIKVVLAAFVGGRVRKVIKS